MKNLFNPAVTILDIFVTVSMATADRTGWEFSDLYEASRKKEWTADGSDYEVVESYEEAITRMGEEWSVCVHISGTPENPTTSYTLLSWNNGRKEEGDRETTGDHDQSIKDVIGWLEADLTENVRDCSNDANHCFQPAFARFATMAV